VKPLLIIALLAGQTFYEWTDASGQTHYTDDPSTIPAKAKRRVTQGAEPVLVTAGADAGVRAAGRRDAGVVAQNKPGPASQDTCELAQQKVRELERRIAEAKDKAAADEQAANERCQQQLRQFGDGAFAQCMAARQSRGRASSYEKELEAAKDELRKAQVGGCS
jgi:hypothetical protein